MPQRQRGPESLLSRVMRPLEEYQRKRNFRQTREPPAAPIKKRSKRLIFVVQEHHASHLHYDFRLEWNGVLRSWAVPKGPSLDPKVKRLAVEVEDHPIAYAKFSGTIPEHEYGGGEVFIWDHGYWEPKGDAKKDLQKGRLEFTLKGKKLKGKWVLVRTRASEKKPQWLLIKRTDGFAETGNEVEPREIEPAKKSKLEFIPPELAELVKTPPSGNDWLHEAKFDGYRVQAHVSKGEVNLFTRSGQNWTDRYLTVAKALEKLKAQSAIFDGEVVWLDENGEHSFQKLQQALKAKDLSSLAYYVFDLLHWNGEDLRPLPLVERRKKLKKALAQLKSDFVFFSDEFNVDAEDFLRASCDLHLEGIISKRRDSAYVSGRTSDWVKSKCQLRQEFVIGGYTAPRGSREGLGALLLGVYENGRFRYVGKVGTGFDRHLLVELEKKLKKLRQEKSPFELKSPRERGISWVKPSVVAEIGFSNWTDEGMLRVAVFQGLREDKPAVDVHRDRAKGKLKDEPVRISHPEKIYFKKAKITKGELAEYYRFVTPWILPQIANRPLSILRCPDGADHQCFFQKHLEKLPAAVHPISIAEKHGKKDYLSVDSEEGLLSLVQWSAIEIHPWSSRDGSIEYPDQVIIDFDPGPGVSWKKVVQGALDLKKMLDSLKLVSFVKVTGGKGIHVHIPCEPRYDWDHIKAFAHSIATEMVNRHPDRYTANMAKASRPGKIFIDYLRNNRGSTAVAPYCVRAREGAAVAMPLEWAELKRLKSGDTFGLKAAYRKIKTRKKDPWAKFLQAKQRIAVLEQARGKS